MRCPVGSSDRTYEELKHFREYALAVLDSGSDRPYEELKLNREEVQRALRDRF